MATHPILVVNPMISLIPETSNPPQPEYEVGQLLIKAWLKPKKMSSYRVGIVTNVRAVTGNRYIPPHKVYTIRTKRGGTRVMCHGEYISFEEYRQKLTEDTRTLNEQLNRKYQDINDLPALEAKARKELT